MNARVYAVILCLLSLGSVSPVLAAAGGEARGTGACSVVVVERPVKICQLIGDYDRERGVPVQSRTVSRFKLVGTDLGVPFLHKGRTYLLFGDTAGLRGGNSIAYTEDADPEDGLTLTFIHDSGGVYKPLVIPGVSCDDFEVPVEGISLRGKIYIYHTTDHSSAVTMGRTVVAVSEDDGKTFRYLYDLSTQHFLNVSVVESDLSGSRGHPSSQGEGLVIFGSGLWRKSDVRLAFQPVTQIETRSAIRYYAGMDEKSVPTWSPKEEDAVPLFHQPCVGEFSVSYNRFIKKWIILYNCGGKGFPILMRTADLPWGPWSDAQVVYDPTRDGGFGKYVHVSWESGRGDMLQDPGKEYVSGVTYGPYQFEHFARGRAGRTTIYFTLSTWNPYVVVLMKVTLACKTGLLGGK